MAGFLFPDHFAEPIDTARLAELAETGDAKAREVLMESARRTGQLCSLLADLLAPEVIVLGSLARYLPAWWGEEIVASFRRESLEINSRHTRIVPAALGEKLQDLSAIAPCVWADRAER